MNGIRLRELDSADLVDVIHYLFEEDLSATTAEQIEARDAYRTTLYETLYGVPYKYGSQKSNASNGNFSMLDDPLNDDLNAEDPEEVPAFKKPPKPYVPPTKFNPDLVNPFAGSKLDAPLN